MKKENPAKALYQRLRLLGCAELWEGEVAAFDRAEPRERMKNVAVVRAVGAVFAESGTAVQKEAARQWLRGLLGDPEERVRRYAMTALPKIGVSADEEAALLALAGRAAGEREKKFLGRALEKIGGRAALEAAGRLGARTRRKVEANVARLESPGALRYDRALEAFSGLRLRLHCRAGLQEIVEDEAREHIANGAPFRIVHREKGLVVLQAEEAFTLGDIFALRCFSTLGIEVGGASNPEEIAAAIASPRTLRLLEAFTEGPIRYRLEFLGRGHQRSAVRAVADRVYARRPALLNDARHALWQMNISAVMEATPKLRPDPRFAYRLGDVPAASHPPLAACLARLAGRQDGEIVWDPFCGSGLELIERFRRGPVRALIGTDRSESALAAARANLAAAGADAVPVTLLARDFRDYADIAELHGVSLIVSNPPMGRRVPIPDLPQLIESLFLAAADVLRPGGRLVFANPLKIEPPDSRLRRESRRKVDLGGFACHLEKYLRVG